MANENQLQKVDGAYHSGYYTAKIRKDVAKEFKMAGLFPTQKVDDKNITVTDVNTYDEIEEQVKGRKKKLEAKGTSLRKIRARVVTPEGFRLEQYGIEMDIEQRDLLEQRISITDIMKPVTKYLAQEIDNNVYQSAVSYATDESTNYGLTNNWTNSEIEDILHDIITIKNKKLEEGYDINHIMLGMDAKTKLDILSASKDIATSKYIFGHNNFELDNTITLNDMVFSWGGKTMDGKELLAFCTDAPALEIFYLDFFNPNVQRVPSIGQYEKYAPLINVLKYDNAKEEHEPIIKMKFATAVGTYPLEKGKRMLKVPNVMGN